MKCLFRPIDISALIFFRLAFGLLGFFDVVSIFVQHCLKAAFSPDQFRFTYYGFEWLHPLAEPWMTLFFLILLLASLGIFFGKWYRLSATVFALGFSYQFLLEKAYYLNHGYLFCILSFVMIVLPANRAFSFDVKKNPSLGRSHIPYWPIFLLQFTMGIVYFFGGIAKINPDWLQAMPLKMWLSRNGNMPIIGALWTQEWVAYLMSYGGLLLDLFVVFFLLLKRTRLWAFAFVVFFHAINLLLFSIGIFPYLSLALTLLFFPPDFPKRILNFLYQKSALLKRWGQNWFAEADLNPEKRKVGAKDSFYKPKSRRLIILCIFVYCMLHVLLPLRHHYFEGSVAWTEEGHRYSWRMMLRDKQGYGNFEIKGQSQEKSIKIDPADYLDKRQERKMYTHPDMILQFAHFLRDQYEGKWKEDVAVYANIKVKLNGRKYQRYIDPGIDLAKERWSFFKSSSWIETMEKE